MEDELKPEETPAPAEGIPAETPKMRPLHSKMKEMYPEREFASDDDFESAAVESLDEALQLRDKTMSANQKLYDLFESDEEVRGFIRDVLNGVPSNIALAKNFDLTAIAPEGENPDYTNALSERQSKLENKRKLQAEIESNLTASDQEIMAFATDRGMTDPEAEGFLKKVDADISDVMKGKVTQKFLACMFKGYNYEEDLKAARDAGKIEGMNEKIEGKMQKDNQELPPDISAGTSPVPVVKKRQWGQNPEM